MKTKLFTKEDISEIASIIKKGGVIAFPTDTVYGLGIRYDQIKTVNRLKKVKQRPETKPFPMMVSNIQQIEEVAKLDEKQRYLINRWMPGAITMVFMKRKEVADYVTNGMDTIAIRMADDAFVLTIIKEVGKPLLVPSANISFIPPSTNYQGVLDQLDGMIDGVVMGECKANMPSTIIDLTGEDIKVLREGPISIDLIKESLQELK